MIKHISKMLWNEKKRFYGILIEQMLVFIVLMLGVVSLSLAIKKYMAPGLLNTDEVFMCTYMADRNTDRATLQEISTNVDVILDNLKKRPYVKVATEGFMLAPYMRKDIGSSPNSVFIDSIKIDGKNYRCLIKGSDENGLKVFQAVLKEGEWLPKNPLLENNNIPVVITRQLAEDAGWEHPTGKTLSFHNMTIEVVGVVEGAKQQAFDPSASAIILNKKYTYFPQAREICVKITTGHEDMLAVDYYKEFNRLLGHVDVLPNVISLESAKASSMQPVTSNIALQLIPTIFLFIFAFLGTLGLFWMYSEKRVPEFGLRIAIGATTRKLISMVVVESMLITSVAILPGVLLACFIYNLTEIHLLAILTTVVIMMAFSAVSAWYPAFRVSRINPAEALHYE